MKKILTTLALAGTLAGGLVGCSKEQQAYFIVNRTYDKRSAGDYYGFASFGGVSPARVQSPVTRWQFEAVSEKELKNMGLNPDNEIRYASKKEALEDLNNWGKNAILKDKR
ncbi:MAG: hypothetical protein AABX66_01590 [Nanoarchaeota archaeon]